MGRLLYLQPKKMKMACNNCHAAMRTLSNDILLEMVATRSYVVPMVSLRDDSQKLQSWKRQARYKQTACCIMAASLNISERR